MNPTNRWHDHDIDLDLFLQLDDLTTVLSRIKDFQFDFTYGSFIDLANMRLTGSSLWASTEKRIQHAGYKTDVYLRAIGTLHNSNMKVFEQFKNFNDDQPMTQFNIQLFTLLEDLRLEEVIKRIRPGTKRDFYLRKKYLVRYFTSQLKTNTTKSYEIDELFSMIFLTLQTNRPNVSFPQAQEKQQEILENIKSDLYDRFSHRTTRDVLETVQNISQKTAVYQKDMRNDYFSFPIFKGKKAYEHNTLFDELTRTDDVENDNQQEVDPENKEYIDEKFSTWHRENENDGRKEMFLQMDLEMGTKTNLLGGEARETESGDQAFASAQGASQTSEIDDYTEKKTLEDYPHETGERNQSAPYGKENIKAIPIFKQASSPTREDQKIYESYAKEIEPYQRILANTIQKIIDHKQTFPRKNFLFGRLSKNLLPIVTEEQPRLFYKKDQPSSEFDAVFTLMVDCSASMQPKMKETKKGIVLFHEVLKELKIPHKIVGFWEEATTSFEENQPNYFHIIHSFTDSLYESNGPKIIQLGAEEDNRDGYSIRVMTEKLIERSEKDKFLLVFSDGEPAAANYDENGLIDTRLAVSESRKLGIHVVGMFLSDGEISEWHDRMMRNIYGRKRVMVPDVAELPELFMSVLQKLLLKIL